MCKQHHVPGTRSISPVSPRQLLPARLCLRRPAGVAPCNVDQGPMLHGEAGCCWGCCRQRHGGQCHHRVCHTILHVLLQVQQGSKPGVRRHRITRCSRPAGHVGKLFASGRCQQATLEECSWMVWHSSACSCAQEPAAVSSVGVFGLPVAASHTPDSSWDTPCWLQGAAHPGSTAAGQLSAAAAEAVGGSRRLAHC